MTIHVPIGCQHPTQRPTEPRPSEREEFELCVGRVCEPVVLEDME